MKAIPLKPFSVDFREVQVQLRHVVISWLGVVAGTDSRGALWILTPTRQMSVPLPAPPVDIFWVSGKRHILAVVFERAVRFVRLTEGGVETQEFSNWDGRFAINRDALSQSQGEDVGLPFGLFLRPRVSCEHVSDAVSAWKQEDRRGTIVTVRNNNRQLVVALPMAAQDIPVRASIDNRVVQVGHLFWLSESDALYALSPQISETGQKIFPSIGVALGRGNLVVCVSFGNSTVTGWEIPLPYDCRWSGRLYDGRVVVVTDHAVLLSCQSIPSES